MLDEIKQDFESALVKHVLFKSKLRSFLHGTKTEESPIRDPEVCSLGQWIRGTALTRYAHLPEAHELDRQHQLVHRVANELMDLHLAGHTEQALAGFPTIQHISDQITVLLQTMQQKLRNGA
ncbi:hypothetical protein HER32_05770 [Hymenobacter sp. BT18]|uniref:CZB domain-containing protein n=1 Tax=Hymenobacter sp. BT18 TaxID=2835648 RepID=UPI00143EEBF5|nr:CZB domain-containing protein [Hymenobacter sp. BT18]QIX60707.1 hypothetical protein HER32_05770 [Hymenobacter sp. BT18]